MATAQVYAVLGKQLRHGKLTREFRWRLDHAAALLQTTGSSASAVYLAVCGGGGEAVAGHAYLQQYHPESLAHLAGQFLDTISRTSFENFRELARFLGSLRDRGHHPLHVTILSSDYHIDRLQVVERYLPTQSLVNEIACVVPRAEPFLCWNANSFLTSVRHYGTLIAWFGQVYTAADRLMPLLVNLDALLEDNRKSLVPPVVERFEHALDYLCTLVSEKERRTLTRITDAADGSARLQDAFERISRQVQALGVWWAEWQATWSDQGVPDNEEDIREAGSFLGGAIRTLRTLSDPDQRVFDPWCVENSASEANSG